MKEITLCSICIYEYIDMLDDIDELKKAAKILLRQDEKKIKQLRSALEITLEFYAEYADDEEDEAFIASCRKMITNR